jgi:hypothetical protein
MQDEVEVVKNTLSKAAGDLVQTQAGNEGKGKSLQEKRKKLEVVGWCSLYPCRPGLTPG